MILLQLSAAQGPAECCLAVARALACLQHEAAQAGIRTEQLEREDGEQPGTLRSVLLSLDGDGEDTLASH